MRSRHRRRPLAGRQGERASLGRGRPQPPFTSPDHLQGHGDQQRVQGSLRELDVTGPARTTAVLLGLFSINTLIALRLSQDGQIPMEVTARYHKAEPTFAACGELCLMKMTSSVDQEYLAGVFSHK